MTSFSIKCILFDLDGTLVSSGEVGTLTWKREVARHNQNHPGFPIDLDSFLHRTHGSRTSETFRRFFPYRDNGPAAVSAFEQQMVVDFGHLSAEIPGAAALMDALNHGRLASSWAVVTSGTTGLATGWFDTLFPRVRKPSVFITATDVSAGKPDPEGYLAAYSRLQKIPTGDTTVVFEDAPTGIKAGVSAGFTVIGVASHIPKERLLEAGASHVIQDFSGVSLDSEAGILTISPI